MIFSFGNKATEDLFHGIVTRNSLQVPQNLWKVAVRKLDMIQAAVQVEDLRSPPGNCLERLKGNRNDKYSIRVNDPYRIVFAFHDGNAMEVEIMDYHS